MTDRRKRFIDQFNKEINPVKELRLLKEIFVIKKAYLKDGCMGIMATRIRRELRYKSVADLSNIKLDNLITNIKNSFPRTITK